VVVETGGAGDDRFLDPGGDQLGARYSNDVLIRFRNGSSNWTDLEVENVDQAFAELQERAGTTRILKDTKYSDPLKFIKVDSSPSYSGLNTEHYVDYWIFGIDWTHREIRIRDWNEGSSSANEDARATVIHEIGHNWDSSLEARSHRSGSQYWRDFHDLHEASGNLNDFARAYGQTDAQEDWATCWEVAFGYTTPGAPSALFNQKLAVVDTFFDRLA
jgi:hypothetical protein